MSVDDLFEKAKSAERESRAVDFKAQLDFTVHGDCCEIIKDLVAMANSGGGAIVIGADNFGQPTGFDCAALLALDPALVTDQINRFTGVQFADFEICELKRRGKKLAVFIVLESPTPMVFSQPGQYQLPSGKPKIAFAKGTLYFRHGAKSEPANTHDVARVIERHKRLERSAVLKNVRKIIAAPSGSMVTVGKPTQLSGLAKGGAPVQITNDPKATLVGVMDPNDIWTLRQTDVIDEVKKRLPGVPFSTHDAQGVRRIHKADDNPQFSYKYNHGVRVYSPAFVDWIVAQHNAAPTFLADVRTKYAAYFRAQNAAKAQKKKK